MADVIYDNPCNFNIVFVRWDLLTLMHDRLTSKSHKKTTAVGANMAIVMYTIHTSIIISTVEPVLFTCCLFCKYYALAPSQK